MSKLKILNRLVRNSIVLLIATSSYGAEVGSTSIVGEWECTTTEHNGRTSQDTYEFHADSRFSSTGNNTTVRGLYENDESEIEFRFLEIIRGNRNKQVDVTTKAMLTRNRENLLTFISVDARSGNDRVVECEENSRNKNFSAQARKEKKSTTDVPVRSNAKTVERASPDTAVAQSQPDIQPLKLASALPSEISFYDRLMERLNNGAVNKYVSYSEGPVEFEYTPGPFGASGVCYVSFRIVHPDFSAPNHARSRFYFYSGGDFELLGIPSAKSKNRYADESPIHIKPSGENTVYKLVDTIEPSEMLSNMRYMTKSNRTYASLLSTLKNSDFVTVDFGNLFGSRFTQDYALKFEGTNYFDESYRAAKKLCP